MEPVNPLGAEARARLAAYRREAPTAAAFQRDWSRIVAAIDDTEIAPDEAEDDDEAPHDLGFAANDRGSLRRWAVGAGLAVAIAAAVLLVLRGVVGAATALGVRSPAPMEAIDRAADDSADRIAHPRSFGAQDRDSATASPSEPPATEEEPATDERVPSTPPPTAIATPPSLAPAEPGRSAPEPDAAQLAEETRLLRAAREALAAGDPEGALRSLADHERRFPGGALLEERMLYDAIARCRGGESGPADAFLRRFPKSPHAPGLRKECGKAP